MSDKQTERTGSDRIRINRFDSPEVRSFKEQIALLIDKCIDLKGRDAESAQIAITRLEEASMWAVRAITAFPQDKS